MHVFIESSQSMVHVDVLKLGKLVACKGPRQTAQTQIRLLLEKQCDQGLLICLLFRQAFVNSSRDNPNLFEIIEREKCSEF